MMDVGAEEREEENKTLRNPTIGQIGPFIELTPAAF